jgi:hypothetical protein
VLKDAWDPFNPSGVERHYFKRITDEEQLQNFAESLKLETDERRVIIMPGEYGSEYGTHVEDLYVHEIHSLVVERFTGTGDPPREWIDERVDFCWQRIAKGFDFRDGRPSWNTKLRTLSFEVEICDVAKLLSSGHLFYSMIVHRFEEFVAV